MERSSSYSQNNPHFCLETEGSYHVHKNPPLDPIRNKRNDPPFLTTRLVLAGLHFIRSLAPTQPEAVFCSVFNIFLTYSPYFEDVSFGIWRTHRFVVTKD